MTLSSRKESLLRWARPALAVYWLLLAAATHWPRLRLTPGDADLRPYINPDKVIHFTAFFGLAMLLFAARPAGRKARWVWHLVIAAAIAFIYAPIDEWTQTFVAERTASWSDLAADWLGVASLALGAVAASVGGDTPLRTRIVRAAAVYATGLFSIALIMPGFPHEMTLAEVPRLDPLRLPATVTWLRADRTGHFIVGLALAALFMASRMLGAKRPWRSAVLAALIAVAAGYALEAGQLAAGMGFDIHDASAHAAGVVLGAILWLVAQLLAYTTTARAPAQAAAAFASPQAEAIDTPVAQDADDAATDTVEAHAEASKKFVGHALLVSLLTIVSRLTGLVRDSVMAAMFGLGGAIDAFFMGFLVPNLFRRLFGEGALSAAFVPVYTRLIHTDRLNAKRLASLCLAALMVFLSGLTLVSEVALYLLNRSVTLSAETHLAIRYTMIMLPYMPMICAVALLGGILQVHGRFGAPSAAPILLNLGMIAAAIVGGRGFIGDGTKEGAIYVICAGVLVSGLAQLVWQLVAVMRVEHFTASLREAWPAFRSMLAIMGPMVIGLAIFQINTFMDSVIAFGMSPREGGAQAMQLLGQEVPYPIDSGGVAALQWAQRLYWFPLGVFGLAIATAIFPALSHAAATAGADGRDRLRRTLQHGLQLSMFINFPASVGLILVRVPLSRVIYERGQFTVDDAVRVATILMGYASVVWAYSMTHVVTRAFYALKDARTPLLISTAMMVLNVILNVILIWPLGAAGLAWSSAVAAVGQIICLLVAIRPFTGRVMDASVWKSFGRIVLLSVLMSGAVLPFLLYRDPASDTVAGALEQLVVTVVLATLVYAGGAWALGAPELRWLLRRRIEA